MSNTIKKEKNGLFKRKGVGQLITITIGLIIMIIVFAIINPSFKSSDNVVNLLRQIVPILIIGVGQSFVLITGNIDLSIGSVIGMSCMISATLMSKGFHPITAIIITIIASLIVGVVNGVLVALCGLPPFIATLGTMTICRGVAQIVNGNYNTGSIEAEGIEEAAVKFKDLFYYEQFSSVILALIIWVVFFIVLTYTKSGRHIYAVGSNSEAAKFSGISVFKSVTKAYLVSAFCACIVGLITTAKNGSGAMDAGEGYEMFAVAASVIGGVSTLGGQGTIIGTAVGAAIWCVLENGLQFAKAPNAIKNIIIGIIVVTSVLIDVMMRSGKLKGIFKKKHKNKNISTT